MSSQKAKKPKSWRRLVTVIDEHDEVTISDNRVDNDIGLEDTSFSADTNTQGNPSVPKPDDNVVQTNTEIYDNIMNEPIITLTRS